MKASDFRGLFCDTHEAARKRFDKEGVTIPFPQRDVHPHQEKD